MKPRMVLYNSLVASHFNYADTVWAGCQAKEKNTLQRTQNFAAKSMLGMRKYDSATKALKTLHLLTLEEKRQIHEAVYIKALAGQAPTAVTREYLKHLSLKENRSAYKGILNIPRHKTEHFKNSPLYRTIKVWNTIPPDIKSATTATFKQINTKIPYIR